MLGRGLESLIPNKNLPKVDILAPEPITNEPAPLSNSVPESMETPVVTPMPEPLENFPIAEPTTPEEAPKKPLPNIEPTPEPLPTPELAQNPINTPASISIIPVSQSFTPTIQEPIASPSNPAPSSKTIDDQTGFEEKVYNLPVEDIKPNPHQPRKVFEEEALVDLANSVKELGIIQPLVVSRAVDKEGVEFFQLIAGERRLTAAKRVGLKTVPAIIKQIKEDRDNLELAIVENIQRADLNPIESARSYAKLQEEFGLTQREIAARMGKSRETIVNVMRLLTLPTYIQEAIGSRQISDSQGRLLLSVSDSQEQRALFDDILANNLSVRDVKIRLTRMRSKDFNLNQVMVKNQFRNTTPEIAYLENKLQESLGTKVSVQLTNNGGKLMINFFSEDELKNIANRLIDEDPQTEANTSEA